MFELFRRLGNVSDSEMNRTFNMGVGMVIVCAAGNVADIKNHFQQRGEDCYEIGKVVAGNREVII